ncbi:MAG: hypothetical protein IKY57_03075 [Alistipes sp.]|nr:hypothetical protein [Alistipes sp.]
MYRKTIYRSLRFAVVLAAAVFGVLQASAQGGAAVSAYSPYTMFGIGELHTIGTAQSRAMAGVGVAWRSSQMPSLANPAGYSATLQKSFLFNVGAEGNFLQNAQRRYDASGNYTTSKNGKFSGNIHEIAVQFPLAKRLGMGLSLMPYSSVGYKMSFLENGSDILGNVGSASYTYSGDGDVTEVKLGVGWEPFKNFSFGIAAKYYWGKITHNYMSAIDNSFVGNGSYLSVVGEDEYAISNFKFQVGLQWNAISDDKNILTFGATYDYGGGLRPKVTKSTVLNNTYETEVFYENEVSQMQLPHSVKAGVMYQNPKLAVALEYEFQAWGNGNNGRFEEKMNNGMVVKYVDTHTAKVGFAYTPNRFDVRNYFNRIAYRFGFRYGNYYQAYNNNGIQQYAVTAGFGFPLKFMGASSIDLSLEYGLRGSHTLMNNAPKIGMIRQDYFKVGLGFSLFGEDYWFVRPKYD